MSEDFKRNIVLAIVVMFISAYICYLFKMTDIDVVETQRFYVSEAHTSFTDREYYIVYNENMEYAVTNPDLVVYCKEHIGEVITIKFKASYDSLADEYRDVEFIEIIGEE